MPTQVTNYQCPACTAPLKFVASSGKLECEYCGSSYDVAEIEALYAEKEEKAIEAFQNEQQANPAQEAAQADLRVYTCPSCSAQLVCDQTTAATSCPYCGNPSVVPGQLTGVFEPNYVIPFQLDKQEAENALRRHYKNKILLPKEFRSDSHIQEIRGVYVPFWLMDMHADVDQTFHATRSSVHRRGDYEIITTRHYNVRRAGTLEFERVPADASSKMPDDYMDSLEPFNYSEMKPFSTAYLPGFLADKYDISAEDCTGRIETRCRNSAREFIRGTVTGYDSCTLTDEKINLERTKMRQALLPVWLLNTRWKGNNYLFAMNGQTGKMVGDLPISWKRFWAIFFATMAPLSALALVFCMLYGGR